MSRRKRCFVYCRISSNPEQDRAGVERQRRELTALAKRLDLDIVFVFTDNDISAYSGKPRPQYDEMISRLHEVDVVLAFHPDRLTRSNRELEDLIDALEAADTPVHTLHTGLYDLSTPGGRLQARIAGACARNESETKSARQRSKQAELAEQGRPGGGRRSFGFKSCGIEHDPIESKIVVEVAERILSGDSVKSIARDLNERGVRTPSSRKHPNGNEWQTFTLKQMITKPRLAGLRTHTTRQGTKHERTTVHAACWKPIIDATQHAQLVALFADPSRRRAHGRTAHLLTGLLRCSKCGAKMRSQVASSGRLRQYVCPKMPGIDGCGGLAIAAEPLEELLIDQLLDVVDAPITDDAIDAAERRDVIDPIAALDEIEQARDELGVMLAKREISARAAAAAERTYDEQESALRARIAESARSTAVVELRGRIRDEWESYSHDRKRAIFAQLIDHVVVLPAPPARERARDPRERTEQRIADPIWRG